MVLESLDRRVFSYLDQLIDRCKFMVQHGQNLLSLDARKPFQEIVNGSAVLQVLEKGGHGNASSSKHPFPTYFLRVPLDHFRKTLVSHNR
jgi:hypothetical protein